MKSKNVSLAVEIYPREGTETAKSPPIFDVIALKFIPVRGRKPEMQTANLHFCVEIYPREGTETAFLIMLCIIYTVEIYPREGTETAHK